MRLRNVKNKEKIMEQASYLITNPKEYRGKWKSYFSNDNPIYLEIGMGKGKFIIENAKLYPNINFIGIEKFDNVLVKAIKECNIELPNLVFIRYDALYIDDLFYHDIDLLYLNFSDPWPKKRHQNRRLTSPIFLNKYNNIFSGNHIIEFRTDNRDLFQYSLVSFSQNGYILEDIFLDFHHDNKPLITTEYEDKFSSENCPIYYVKCFKRNV